MKRIYWVGVLVLACGQVCAQQDQLDAQRNEVNLEADAAERVCQSSFAVNDCVKKVQVRKRQQLSEVRRDEVALHDRQRKEQAAALALQTAEKQVQREKQLTDGQSRVSDADARKLQQDDKRRLHQGMAPVGGKAPSANAGHPAPKATQGYRTEWQRKQQEAEKKRLDRDRRLQDKAKSKPVPGLPTTP